MRVRRSHPLAAELRACFVFGGGAGLGLDLVTGAAVAAGNSPTPMASQEGPALDISGTSYVSAAKDPGWNITGELTLAWRGLIRTPNALGQLVGNIPSGGNGATDTPFSFEYGNSSDGSLKLVRGVAVGGDNFRVYATAAGVIAANTWTTLAVSQVSGYQNAPSFYVDGAARAVAFSFGLGSGATGTNNDPLWIGRRQDGYTQMDGLASVLPIAARVWSADEHAAFDADPYALIEDAPLYHFLAPSRTTHALTAGSIAAGTPLVGAPALSQDHALSPGSVPAGAPLVGAAALAQAHALTAASIAAGAALVGAATLAQVHALAAGSVVAGRPIVGAALLNAQLAAPPERTLTWRYAARAARWVAEARTLTWPAAGRTVTWRQ